VASNFDQEKTMERTLSAEELKDYKTNGVAVLRNAVDGSWVERMSAVIDQQLAAPSKWSNDGNPDATENRQFTDRYLWQENAEINAFIRESGCARLAAEAMESSYARFYFDHLLVKEANTQAPTPWHQDAPYWPFLGKQICSIWVALTPCDIAGSAMEFVSGSHLDDKYYVAESFLGKDDANQTWQAEGKGEKCPDIEAARDNYNIIGWDMAPGDAVIFSAWTLHGAHGNSSANQRRLAISTRWLGDDVIWQPHSGSDPTVKQEDLSIQPGQPPLDDVIFPELWRGQ
jgi:ectoine hydroxylase-related dioxygenase (phytanoyl-CoA dioxygenase family)